jgi:hypothetical protein
MTSYRRWWINLLLTSRLQLGAGTIILGGHRVQHVNPNIGILAGYPRIQYVFIVCRHHLEITTSTLNGPIGHGVTDQRLTRDTAWLTKDWPEGDTAWLTRERIYIKVALMKHKKSRQWNLQIYAWLSVRLNRIVEWGHWFTVGASIPTSVQCTAGNIWRVV